MRRPQESGHYQAFSDPNYGGKVWNESGGPASQPNSDPSSPITITAERHTFERMDMLVLALTHANERTQPFRPGALTHTESKHVSTLSFSLVIGIASMPAPFGLNGTRFRFFPSPEPRTYNLRLCLSQISKVL